MVAIGNENCAVRVRLLQTAKDVTERAQLRVRHAGVRQFAEAIEETNATFKGEPLAEDLVAFRIDRIQPIVILLFQAVAFVN
jgi:hypothetical protein